MAIKTRYDHVRRKISPQKRRVPATSLLFDHMTEQAIELPEGMEDVYDFEDRERARRMCDGINARFKRRHITGYHIWRNDTKVIIARPGSEENA